jgi:hypothetical protein
VSEHDKKTASVISVQLEQLSLDVRSSSTVTFADQSQAMFSIKVIRLSSVIHSQ